MFVPIKAVDMSLSRFTGILYLLTIIPELKSFIRTDRIGNILLPAWIFFGFLTVVSLLNINEISKEYFNMVVFQNTLFFWFLINHERKDYMIIEKGMFCFVLGSILLVVLFFAGIGVVYEKGNRLSMFGDNQNSIGIKMVVSSIVLFITVTQNRLNLGRYRYLLLLIIPFMLIFIRETGSRLSIITFILAFMTGTILYKTKNNLVKIGILIGGAMALILIGFLLIQSDTLVNRMESTSNLGDLGERDLIWKTIFPIIQENPIVGIGNTGYEFQTNLIWGRYVSPHNVILELLCLTGLIGLTLYFTFMFQVIRRGYEPYKRYGLLLPVLLIIPILGMLLSSHMLESKIAWCIFAYIVSSSAIAIKSLRNHRNKIFLSENPLCN